MLKQKVAYVVGMLDEWRHLAMFESLDQYEVEVHAISQSNLLSSYRSNLKLYLYENISDMPGYMRGLEERIAGSNLIVSKEISTLSTFQATRIAQKYNIPSLVMVSENRPNFYKDYSNITAIQSDILHNSTGFVALSKHSSAMLDFYNVNDAIKTTVNSCVASSIPEDVSMRSMRFRKNANLSPDDILLGVFADLDDSFKAETLFSALRMVKAKDPYESGKFKIVVVGQGSNEQKLKYLAFEMGIGNQVLFIHEDTQSYYIELLSALDYVLHLEPDAHFLEHHEKFPRYLLDAVACQSLALVQSGSVAKEILGENCIEYKDNSEYNLSTELINCLDRVNQQAEQALDFSTRIKELYSPESIRPIVSSVFNTLIQERDSETHADRFSKVTSEIGLATSRADYTGALHLVEEGILNFSMNLSYLSVLFQLKGDILRTLNRSDEAVESYAKAIEYDPKNVSVYLSLGLISFHGQAYPDAITFYKKALGLETENNEAMVGLGMSYFRNNMHNEAMYWLKKATVNEGQNGKALTALIQAASDCSDQRMGVSALESVLDSLGESNRLLMALGRLYMKTGQSEKGHIFVQRALSTEKDVA